MCHWSPVLAFLVPALLIAAFFPLQADTESQSAYTSASCFRKETYNTTSKVKVQIPVNKTRYDWCLGGFMRCMVYKVEMAEKEINVTEIRSRIVEMCCPGTIPAPGTPAQSTNESLQCIPAPGSATPPTATAATTTTVTTTTTPREVCKAGLWGRGCAHRCLCDGNPCDHDTGICKPCSPNDETCAPSSTTSTTTTTTTTTPVPTTASTTQSSTYYPSTTSTTTTTTPSTTFSTPSTTTSTTTMISTLATTNTSTHRTVETSPRISPSNTPEIPVAASTESSRTVSTTGSTARITESTTIRLVVATREHGTIERRKEAPGKSMAQPAKTTAQPIDPEAVNRVDTSPGNGKPKLDSPPTNSSITTTPPSSTTSQKPTSPSIHSTSFASFPVPRTSTLKPSTTISTTNSKPTLSTQVSATPKQTTLKPSDSSEESDSDEGDDSEDDDDDGDDDDDEEDLVESKDLKTIDEPTAGVNRGYSVQYSVTSPRSVDISQLGSPPKGGLPSNPSATESGAAGAAVAAVAIALAILAILCVLVIFVQTRNQRSKRRPGVAPPPSPPLISAWHSVPHYSDTFAAPTAVVPPQPTSPNQAATAATSPFSEQFEQPAVEHVYQEITPLANVAETSPQPTDSSTLQQDTGPTKVMVKLRNVETYHLVR